MRLADYIEVVAGLMPEREAFVDAGGRMTFAEVRAFMHRVANRLDRDPSLPRGAGVAVYAPNETRVSLLQLGINRADRVWVLVHTRNTPQANAEIIDYADTRLVLFHSAFEAAVPIIAAKSPGMRFVCIDRASDHGLSLRDWLGDSSDDYVGVRENPLDAAFMAPTGGTTGVARAVVHTHESVEFATAALRQALKIDENVRHLVVAPLTHAAGFMALAFAAFGASNIILPGFDLDMVLNAVGRERITHLYLPPTALYALMAHPKLASTDLSSLSCIVVGAAPVAPAKFKEAVRIFGPIVHEGYGQTEALLPVTIKYPKDYLRTDGSYDEAILRSAGRPGPFMRVEIMDDQGRLLPPGQPGEVVLQSSMTMKGYYKMPKETAEVSKFGWHHTTDIGMRDDRGYITIIDRLKDMIVSGGFNIFPAEIEAVINELPQVLDCSVVGVPDEHWGEAVKAVLQLKPGQLLDEDTVIAHCKARLGGLKTPKSVEFWPDLPRSPVGKLLKREVRAKYWQGQWRSV